MSAVPIYDLRSDQCRFPTTPDGAKLHLFCAEPTEEKGATYCTEHAALCFDRRSLADRKAAAARLSKWRVSMGLVSTRPTY